MFVGFESKDANGRGEDYAYLRIRSNQKGGDFVGPQSPNGGGRWG